MTARVTSDADFEALVQQAAAIALRTGDALGAATAVVLANANPLYAAPDYGTWKWGEFLDAVRAALEPVDMTITEATHEDLAGNGDEDPDADRWGALLDDADAIAADNFEEE